MLNLFIEMQSKCTYRECSQIYDKQIVLRLEDCFAAFQKNS